MFFDHLDERNAMVKSVIHFANFIKWTFFVVNIPSMLSGHLDDRNMMIISIMPSGHFWVSTHAPCFLVKLAY
jgi:hypothetical protein